MPAKHILAAVMVTAIFGLNYCAIKLGLSAFDPLLLAGLRFSLCALPAIFFVPRPSCAFRYVALYGIFMCLGLWAVLMGMHAGLSAGVSALILQLGALITVLVGVALFKEKLSAFNIVGVLLSLAGLGLISSVADGSVPLEGMAFALLGTALWVIANTAIKKSATDQPFRFIIWSSPVSALLLFTIRGITSNANPLHGLTDSLDATAIATLLFIAYVTTLFAYSIWTMLLSRYALAISAPTYLLVPIFGMVFSHLIFNETIGGTKIAAAAFILSGVAINACGGAVYGRLHSRLSDGVRSIG